MTGQLLQALGEVKADALTRFALALLVLILLPLTLLLDLLCWVFSGLRVWLVFRATEAHCPRGHTLSLLGDFTCPECGLTTADTHAWASCDACGHTSFGIRCACGLYAKNPLAERLS